MNDVGRNEIARRVDGIYSRQTILTCLYRLTWSSARRPCWKDTASPVTCASGRARGSDY
jgi:hypothetical protein